MGSRLNSTAILQRASPTVQHLLCDNIPLSQFIDWKLRTSTNHPSLHPSGYEVLHKLRTINGKIWAFSEENLYWLTITQKITQKAHSSISFDFGSCSPTRLAWCSCLFSKPCASLCLNVLSSARAVLLLSFHLEEDKNAIRVWSWLFFSFISSVFF